MFSFSLGMTTEAESIFLYNSGKTHASYSFPDFRPQFIDQADPVLLSLAQTKCPSGDLACIFDYVFTGSETVALETAGTQAATAADTTILGK